MAEQPSGLPDTVLAEETRISGAERAAAEVAATGPERRKLGLGGWIAASWLILLVLVAVIAPSLEADPISRNGRVIEGCGDGKGLPIYDPLNCSDLLAKRNQRLGTGHDGKFTHVFGVDASGRDVFSAVLVGTRTTLLIAVTAIAAATLLGGALGLVSGFFRGGVDTGISILFDVMIAFPPLILALLVVNFFAANNPDRRIPGIIFALVVVATPILGRISRASTLAWSEREFVTAARALGAKPGRIIVREVLPNVAPAMMSISMLGVGIVVATEASLALIGLGVPADKVSWGSVVAAGGADFRNYSHLVFVPGTAIVITVCALNFFGDALRQKFNVRESVL